MVIKTSCTSFVIMIVFFITNISTTFAASLGLHTSSQHIEHGKFIAITLSWPRSTPALDTIDLKTWRTDFYITTSAVTRQNGQQSLSLRLYPYDTGTFTLSALEFGNSVTSSRLIRVTPAVDPKSNKIMTFKTLVSTTEPWLKQQIKIQAQLEHSDEIVVLDTQQTNTTTFALSPIPVFVQRGPDASAFIHQTGWHVHALRDGLQHLEGLFINFYRDGVRTHQFAVRPYVAQVKPLPAYLPGTIPVGKLEMVSLSDHFRWSITDNLTLIPLRLRAEGMLEGDIPNITRQLHNTNSMQFFDATSTQTAEVDVAGKTLIRDYTVPVSMTSQGLIQPPNIRVNYFDPDLGRLQTLHHTFPRILSMRIWMVVLMSLLCTVFGLKILKWSIKRLYRKLRYWQQYRHIATALNRATTVTDLRDILKNIAIAEGWPDNTTLSQWARYCQHKVSGFPALDNLIADISAAIYNNSVISIALQQQRIRMYCAHRSLVLRLVFCAN